MTGFVEWLLDLHNIRLGRDAPLLVQWDSRVQAWMLFCFAVVALAWVIFVYRHEAVSLPRRILLALGRCALIALVTAIICRPSLVLQRNRVEKAYVALLLDTSLSMVAADGYQDEEELAQSVARGAGVDRDELEHHSRLALVQSALASQAATPLRRLLEQNDLQVSTFAGGVETLGFADSLDAAPVAADLVRAAQADGTSTDLAGAVQHVVEKAQGRRIAAIVLATDGQATEPTGLKDAVDLARGRQIPLHALRIGSPNRSMDVEVGPLRAEETVFVNDLLAIEAPVRAVGVTSMTPVTLRLVDDRTGAVVDTRQVALDPEHPTMLVELQVKPTQVGRRRYRVEAGSLPREHLVSNNVDTVDVRVVEDRLRVLYVDGYPRYEYRYLKNALLREPTVELSVLLLDADEQFVQDGTLPLRRFPESPEELNGYDVVLFGDVDPRGGWLSPAQTTMLLDFVGHEGGGFGLICGERSAPYRFLNTSLEKLVPVRIDPQFLGQYDNPLATGFQLQLTPEGRASRLFRAAAQRPSSTPDPTHRNADFETAELYWYARTLGVKPGATVLAEHPTIRTSNSSIGSSGLMPLMVTGRYGAGKLFFQATDDTWRWRRHTGEFLHDTYWVQVVRELMRGSRAAQDRRMVIRTDRRSYDYGQPVQIQVEVTDSELLTAQPEALPMIVTQQSGASPDPTGQRDDPAHSTHVARIGAARLGASSKTYEASYVPPQPGSFTVELDGVAVRPGEAAATVAFRVERPDLEARNPQADHDTLRRMADATGGRLMDLDRLETEFAAIRDRSVLIPDDIIEPLWDSKLVLILFGVLMTVEWILRKAFGLL